MHDLVDATVPYLALTDQDIRPLIRSLQSINSTLRSMMVSLDLKGRSGTQSLRFTLAGNVLTVLGTLELRKSIYMILIASAGCGFHRAYISSAVSQAQWRE